MFDKIPQNVGLIISAALVMIAFGLIIESTRTGINSYRPKRKRRVIILRVVSLVLAATAILLAWAKV